MMAALASAAETRFTPQLTPTTSSFKVKKGLQHPLAALFSPPELI
jgi:hypothetical protein